MNNQNNYDLLLQKIDAFTRKYYRNQVIKGSIYTLAVLLIFFLFVVLMEYVGWFGTGVRSVLFYSFIGINVFILVRLVAIPLLKTYRLGKIISHEQASRIIGNHFPNISDKLLNTLQLKEQTADTVKNLALVNASINQKAAELKPVPFSNAIDLTKNKRFLPYAAVPLLVMIVLLFAAPNVIKDSTRRIVNHNTAFEKPAPFRFVVTNNNLKAVQQEDFQLKVKIEGEEIPESIYLLQGNNKFKLDKTDKLNFGYLFENLQKTTSFKLFADGFESQEYELTVVPKPVVLNFDLQLSYPAYLRKQNETLKNTGDIIVPAGTRINWKFTTQNTGEMAIRFTDTTITLNNSENTFAYARTFVRNNNYAVTVANNQLKSNDSMMYAITVTPDAYPSIEASEQKDSLSTQKIYFSGIIKDDYGFSRLSFVYRFINAKETQEKTTAANYDNISINKSQNTNQFFYYWDASALNVLPGDQIEYYFEVWDNDGVSGPKSARSQSQLFKAPTEKELQAQTDKSNDDIKKDLSESLKDVKKLQKKITDEAKKLLEKKNADYDDKKKIEDLIKEQKALEEKIKSVQQQQQQSTAKQNEYNKENELAEKQKQIEELFNKLQNQELKDLMKQLEQMLSQFDKQKTQEMLDKMKLTNKDLEKQLDRTLELFKQLEVEQKLKDAISNLDKLADEQQKLAEKAEDKKVDGEQLQKEQKELGNKFDEIKKDLQELQKKNEQLEFPQELADTKQEEQQVDQEMQNSEQQLGDNKKSKASQSQKNASKKMQQMSQKMQQQMAQQEEEQQEEDMQSLRYLLENLIRFSFDQESLMADLKKIDIMNPEYVKLGQRQRKLKDDVKIIEDSLFALSKRVMQIQNLVNTEVGKIDDNIGKSIDQMEDRMVPQARSSQQFVMTSANNLALLLNESLEQMQQQQQQSQQQKQGGQCKKPGKGKPGPNAQKLKMMQQQLSQQLKDMKGKMENGKKSGQSQKGMSEELARMAAQQEAIRNELNQLNQQENKDGKNSMGNLGQVAEKMEQNERDIVNKKITEETLKRQQEIVTRLLEAENAQREREQDEQRKAEQAKEQFSRNPQAFEEYKRLKEKETELLKTVPPSLNPYYKNLVNSYFQNLSK